MQGILQGAVGKHSFVISDFEYERACVIQSMVKSLYTGEVEFSAETVQPLKSLYRHLLLDGFVEACEEASKLISTFTVLTPKCNSEEASEAISSFSVPHNIECRDDGNGDVKTADGFISPAEISLATNNAEISHATNNAEISLATNNAEISLATNNAEISLATNNAEISLSTNNSEISLETDNAEISHETNNAEISLATNNAEISLATNNAENSLATKNAENSLATNNAEISLATNNAEISPATNNAEISLALNNAENSLATNNAEISLATNNAEISHETNNFTRLERDKDVQLDSLRLIPDDTEVTCINSEAGGDEKVKITESITENNGNDKTIMESKTNDCTGKKRTRLKRKHKLKELEDFDSKLIEEKEYFDSKLIESGTKSRKAKIPKTDASLCMKRAGKGRRKTKNTKAAKVEVTSGNDKESANTSSDSCDVASKIETTSAGQKNTGDKSQKSGSKVKVLRHKKRKDVSEKSENKRTFVQQVNSEDVNEKSESQTLSKGEEKSGDINEDPKSAKQSKKIVENLKICAHCSKKEVDCKCPVGPKGFKKKCPGCYLRFLDRHSYYKHWRYCKTHLIREDFIFA